MRNHSELENAIPAFAYLPKETQDLLLKASEKQSLNLKEMSKDQLGVALKVVSSGQLSGEAAQIKGVSVHWRGDGPNPYKISCFHDSSLMRPCAHCVANAERLLHGRTR